MTIYVQVGKDNDKECNKVSVDLSFEDGSTDRLDHLFYHEYTSGPGTVKVMYEVIRLLDKLRERNNFDEN